MHLGLSGASLGPKIKKAGVCIEMDKCKKQIIKGVNCFERKIHRDPSSCTRLPKVKNVIRRIGTR